MTASPRASQASPQTQIRHRARRAITAGLIAAAVTAPLLVSTAAFVTTASASPAMFKVGAAQRDVTPPALVTPAGQALDTAEFVPFCGTSEAQVQQLWPGRRLFAFEKPYIDKFGAGQYVPGDPFCDADATHRYEAPYIAGGSGGNHWPLTSGDSATPGTTLTNSFVKPDPIGAEAAVFTIGTRRVAIVTIDSIGLFDTTMDQIRAIVHRRDPGLAPANIFISSTHDESAPDPIGLWGPDVSGDPSPVNQVNGDLPAGVTSGVDDYYMHYLVTQAAGAIVQADTQAQPAALKLTTARMPANTQSCWSSYPFIDTNLMPVMQAVATQGPSAGHAIFTLVNVGTHDESLAFSNNPSYESMLSGDWTGRVRDWLESDYPGSVGMEMAGLVGSVETPAVYPQGTQVLDVPGARHDVPGNPVDRCASIYPEPANGAGAVAPYSDALQFVDVYGKSVADTAVSALSGSDTTTVTPTSLSGQSRSVCLQLENNLFVAAFAADLFPDRPAFADPACTVGLSLSGKPSVGLGSTLAPVHAGAPAFLKSGVGVATIGPVQIAYSPGEVFPITEVGGPVDDAQMPFPTNCYEPSTSDPTNVRAGNYTCGTTLPMTPDVSGRMTKPFRFLAGLGQDMIGYVVPPGNFVGSQGETFESPWSVYENTGNTGGDRFGYGHSDDSESVGPNAGVAVTDALMNLLSQDGSGTPTLPGLFVDSHNRLCDSPFPANAPEDTGRAAGGSWVAGCGAFSGAVGVKVVEPNGATRTISVGTGAGDASAWATYLATADTGTAGTAYRYSTATRGVVIGGAPLLIDVFAGAQALAF